MAKRRNSKPKNVTKLVEVEQPAPSVEVPSQSEPVVAIEDLAPVPTEAVSELPAIGEAPSLAAEPPAPAEPVILPEADPASALAAAVQPIDAPVAAMDAQTVVAEPAPAIDGPTATEPAGEGVQPRANAAAEATAPVAAAMVPIGRNRPYFARAAFGAVIGSLVPMVLVPAAEPVKAEAVEPDGLRATNASLERLVAEVATLKATVAARAVAAPPVAAGATAANVDALARDVALLKASFGTSQTSADTHLTELVAQVNRAEKGESELATRLARIEKPEVTRADVSTEITGSVQPATPPIAEGWVLWRVYNGRAVVQSRRGYFDVVPGVDLPDLGLVREITQRDGGWVVITQNGTIVPAPGHPLG